MLCFVLTSGYWVLDTSSHSSQSLSKAGIVSIVKMERLRLPRDIQGMAGTRRDFGLCHAIVVVPGPGGLPVEWGQSSQPLTTPPSPA